MAKGFAPRYFDGMKIVILLIGLSGLFFLLAYVFGWKNFGYSDPVIAQKLQVLQGTKPALSPPPADTAGNPLAEQKCQAVLDAVRNGQSIDGQLTWLAGYVAAATADQPLPAALLQPVNLRLVLLAVCAEMPGQLLKMAAPRALAALQGQKLQ